MQSPLDLKSSARQIFQQTLAGINIAQTLSDKLCRSGSCIECEDAEIDLASFKSIRVIALGKASHAMTEGLVELLSPEFPLTGIVVGPTAPSRPIAGFEVFVSGHPTPNEQSFAAARAVLHFLRESDRADTLIFFLISGGGSSLVELPLDSAISLEDFQALHRALVGCGASIEEINTVRKHLSAVKGGRLAAAASNATKVTLGVTDVPHGRESALASGPTLPDPTTVADARKIAEQFSLLPKMPPSIRNKFSEPGGLIETPKRDHPTFGNSYYETLLGMHDLFHHAHLAAEGEGFHTICDNCTDDWPVERATEFLVGEIIRLGREVPNQPVALIADGEVSSPVHGDGIGGRNSAFVLDCVARIAGRRLAVLSAGTDGIDGSSPAAGAVADGESLARATALGFDPRDFARRSDSYSFFNAIGDAVVTGPTGNNLRDLRIFLAAPESES
jgi:glycerate 2-kinase